MSKITFANRHTYVKDAIRFTLMRYGIQSTNEPNYYNYAGGDFRPDITVRMNGVQNVATDVTIVKPHETEIGRAAKEAAEKKSARHNGPVAEYNHVFVPFAVETTGHLDDSCFLFLKKMKYQIPFHQRLLFRRDFLGNISTALARYRADAMQNVAANSQTVDDLT